MAAVGDEGHEGKAALLPLPGKRASSDELLEIENALQEWAVGRHCATPDVVRKVKLCLQEEFLLGLVEPNSNHFWPANPDGRSWRYLFRRQCFRVLGVHERIPEGHPDGLPAVVNNFIRMRWWPDPDTESGAEASVGPSTLKRGVRGGRSGGPISNGRVRKPTAPYTIHERRSHGRPLGGPASNPTCPDVAGASDSLWGLLFCVW